MLRLTELRLPLDHSDHDLAAAVRARLQLAAGEFLRFQVCRRGHDARNARSLCLVYSVDAEVADEAAVAGRVRADRRIAPVPAGGYRFPVPAAAPPALRPVIIGTGPCGLFAGLVLAEHGYRPLLLERGAPVEERARAVARFAAGGDLDPETNIQFGEGGAGTFSDGKLYSRIHDRAWRGRKVIDELVAAGAPAEIAILSKPHIGTDRLSGVVRALREKLIALGGTVRFHSRVDDLLVTDGCVRGVVLAGGETIAADRVIFAGGHSARDTIRRLQARGVDCDAKPFALGVRIEHPQALIDTARFGPHAGHPLLGAADYQLVHHGSDGRTVFSFCMCPGGTVVAAASAAGGVVTNGMSCYARDSGTANSALVVGVTPADFPGGPLAGFDLQRQWEEAAFRLGGGAYHAPAQRVGDFLAGVPSTAPGAVLPTYRPGVRWCDLRETLPAFVVQELCAALPALERKLPGFALPDAVLTGVETRTSSPVRLTRGEDGQSVSVRGLYPAGEGAGYAGGILSSAVDGIRAAELLACHSTGAAAAAAR